MSRNSRVRRTAAVLAVAAVLATGCGGGDTGSDSGSGDMDSAMTSSSAPADAESSSSAAEEEPGTSTAIDVASVDFGYEMEEDSFSPGTYEITLTNTGSASHNLVVERDGEDVAETDIIGPGETATVEVTLEEGEYVFYCSVGSHRSMGMEIPVEVTA